MTVVCVFLLVHVYLLFIPGQILIMRFIFRKYKNGDNTTHTIIVMIKWGKSEEWLVYNRPSHLLPEGKVQSILQLKSSNLLKQFYFFIFLVNTIWAKLGVFSNMDFRDVGLRWEMAMGGLQISPTYTDHQTTTSWSLWFLPIICYCKGCVAWKSHGMWMIESV